jgi:hypothetical protein
MPMTPAGLSAVLHSKLESFFEIEDDAILQKFCDACGEAIVTYIQGNADVVSTSHSGEDLSSPTGQQIDVTTGPGAGSGGATSEDKPVVGMGSIL